MSDAQLAQFVAATAAMLDLPLDDQRLEAVRHVLRAMEPQIALVLGDTPSGGLA